MSLKTKQNESSACMDEEKTKKCIKKKYHLHKTYFFSKSRHDDQRYIAMKTET